ncbi:FAD binding domain-containing protein [Tranquillimonas alkanivorans]|uniref:Xanthine dehydrogenase YagS FAD-binding subunit n=1 Tax=Tranquillimonas alkanivorans TaxID=441119 RepID=A0A1I5RUA5_9RHOB|nr:FAD binding domain-containing protein [Tranquillimonas alkanivorans]SFP61977.1 xanthine dehydrogenase YagS FAD-binding subunit [Tranquillimonas alkanivorans]
MLTRLHTLAQASQADGEFRAGGTDLHDRLRSGVSDGPLVDIIGLPGLDGIDRQDDGCEIGALLSLDGLARNPDIVRDYPGLAQAAAGLATPQIRRAATVGGCLLQRTRCAYFRHPDLACTRKGDAACGGRKGVHDNGVIFDQGGCAHPHASSLGMALLAYDGRVRTTEREMSIADLYGGGSAHDRDHLLAPGELLTHVLLPPPAPGERAAYLRAISRAEAEWPIVESLVRLFVNNGTVTEARVAAGAVSQVPLRLHGVEAALVGRPAQAGTWGAAAARAGEGANPLPQAAWKVTMLERTVLTALEQAAAHETVQTQTAG